MSLCSYALIILSSSRSLSARFAERTFFINASNASRNTAGLSCVLVVTSCTGASKSAAKHVAQKYSEVRLQKTPPKHAPRALTGSSKEGGQVLYFWKAVEAAPIRHGKGAHAAQIPSSLHRLPAAAALVTCTGKSYATYASLVLGAGPSYGCSGWRK